MRREILKRRKSARKISAIALSLMLVLSMLPVSFLGIEAQAATTGKVADNNTINEWQDYFLDLEENGTSYAGGVWTDKSVFESGEDLDNALSGGEAKTGIVTEEDNFVVAMSALATNKEIVGYSTIPTDTVLVLDVSQSMDNAKSVDNMVNAANDAIDDLLKLNKNNRVGVVLYSGSSSLGQAATSTGTKLLDLDRYVAGTSGNYLTYTGTDDTTVSIASNLKYENGRSVRASSKNTVGGTYIQNGIDIAGDMFKAANPVVEEDNVQKGDTRMPILVLMSDGAPTHADTTYTDIGTSNMGTGASSTATAGIGFATQLTAAFVKENMEDHYGKDAKFYTVGLNLNETTGHAVAASVLNPRNSTNAISNYWNTLFDDGEVSFYAHNTSGNQSQFTISRPVNRQGEYTDMLERDDQYYVDRAFDADSNEELESAFESIVEEIVLQSAYYPTYIENGNYNLDGYVTFSDEIGHFMEVKEVEGILLGNAMFTGEALVEMMQQGEFGNASEATKNGAELVESFAARIGVDEETTENILQNAWRDNQLYYTNDNDYSNYIGWYEAEDGAYVGIWKQQDGEDEHQNALNSGAKYITKSYCYYGYDEEGSIVGNDMMHIIVKVRTEIETGLQQVIFEIPASLVPIITYEISLGTQSYETAKEVEMEVSEATPIRLLFEVGLRSDINEYNLAEIMEAEGTHSHPVTNAAGEPTGEYYFYTNVWGYGKDQTQLEPGQHEVAESVFTPSVANERYYYTENTVILVKDGNDYVPYKGVDAPAGEGYFSAHRVFRSTGNGKIAEVDWVYEAIGSETFSQDDGAKLAKNEDGEWYIKKGAARTALPSYHIEKNVAGGGATETLRYSRYAVINSSEEVEDYAVHSFQGNNGRLKMAPATGIQLTKEVDETITDANITYTFAVQLNENVNGTYTLYKDGAESDIAFVGGAATVELKAGETVIISGIPAGEYTVTETIADGADYRVSSVTVDGVEENGIVAEDVVTTHKVDAVVFTNTEVTGGELVVYKNVNSDYPDAEAAVNGKEFTFTIAFEDAAGNPLAAGTEFDIVKGGTGDTVTLDANGSFTTTLKHSESVAVKDVPKDVVYVVTETNLPEGFVCVTPAADLTGTIVKNESATVTVVNEYRPEAAPAMAVEMTKTMTGRAWAAGDSFSFRLEKMNADNDWSVVKVNGANQEGTVTTEGGKLNFVIPSDELDTIGTHQFRVIETNANAIPGIISDAARYITVVVAETDGDGVMEIASVEINDEAVSANDGSIELTFENVYRTTGDATVSIPVKKYITNDTGVDVSLEGFTFKLADENGAAVEGGSVTSNTAGEAEIHLTYSAAEFDAMDAADGADDNVVVINYTLSEVEPQGGTGNFSYDKTIYNVTVTLTSEDGELAAEAAIVNGTASVEAAEFTNTFDITDNARANFTLNAKKTLNGRDQEAGEFKFNLYATAGDFVVPANANPAADGTNTAQGAITFDTLVYDTAGTYYYVAKEEVPADTKGVSYSKAAYNVTVEVTYDEATGKLVAEETIVQPGVGTVEETDVVFINEYRPEPTSILLSGSKELAGRDMAEGEFEFVVMEGDKEIASTVNAADGTFTFPEITFTASGTYNYIVKEVIPEDAVQNAAGKLEWNHVTYDETAYTVTVTVVDDGEGTLTATPVIDGEELAFANTYKAAAAKVTFGGTKTLVDKNLYDDEFTFALYAADDNNFSTEGKTAIDTATNKDGAYQFAELVFDAAGTYYYVVEEQMDEDKAGTDIGKIDYDKTKYEITVVVTDVEGQLKSEVSYNDSSLSISEDVTVSDLDFTNTYYPAGAALTIEGKKTLSGDRTEVEKDEFTFVLSEVTVDADGKEIVKELDKVKNDADGKFVFYVTALVGEYTEIGTYHYQITEEAGIEEGMKYDATVFDVFVEVTNAGEGTLVVDSVEYLVDETVTETVQFNNYYEEPEVPVIESVDTGDNFKTTLYMTTSIIALIVAAAAIYGKKKMM